VLRILGDHGLGDHPRRVVVNKCDAVRDPAAVREVALVHHAWQVSAATREGLAGLMAGLEPAVLVAQSERQRQAGAALAQSDFGSWSPLG
jgi:50S ribosomal subunit-associated GTPase HflX